MDVISSLAYGKITTGRSVTQPDSVSTATRQCIALFGRARIDESLDSGAKADIENQLARFKIWAGMIGVLASGSASTDSRLKNDDDIKEVMVDMLFRLRKTIDEYLRPTIAEESEDDELEEASNSRMIPRHH